MNFNLLDPKIPLVFSDGTQIYEELAQTYIRHDKGYFIMAPSGAGKTHFVNAQTELHWIDGDILWMKANAHPDGHWWAESIDRITEIDQQSDIITMQAKKLGFWIVGASNAFLPPDAIVVPDWETHKKWIAYREQNNYDGGATSDRLEQVQGHREWILTWQEKGVPKFESMEAAAEFLTRT